MFREPPPPSVTDIDEPAFWKALRVPRGCPDPELLRSAVAHGLAGRKAKAYAALAQYHAKALGSELDFQRKEAEQRTPADPDRLRDTLNHKIVCWHKQTIQFGPTIDWNPPGLASVGGFHYFGFFRPVVDAYLRTGCKDCEAFILDIVTQYRAYQQGPNWTKAYKWIVFNQLGASHKFESWLPAYLALAENGTLTTEAAESFMKHFLGFGRALKLGNKQFIAHNIATHGCRCLMTIARLFPEFRESGAWDRLGTLRIYEQAVKGFHADGGHFERVWGYGSYTLQSVGEAYKTARRHGGLGKWDGPMRRAIRRAYRFYAKTLGPAPDYLQPTYGDSGQGGMKGVLERGLEFFPAGTGLDLGVDRTRSYLLRQSGFAVFRNGDDRDSVYLNLSCGKFAGWHSHQDLLSLNLWAFGRPLLEELGRFGPYEMPLDTLFRAPDSHNQLTIDGMVYNCRDIKGEGVVWHSNELVDFFSATHWAYQYFCFGRQERCGTSPNIEARVRRTVLFVKDPGYALVMDSVCNRFTSEPFAGAVTQNWHSPRPFARLDQRRAATRGRPGCLLAFARPEGLARLDPGVDFTRAEGEQWGVAYDRYSLKARRWMPLGYAGRVGFATLLFPYRKACPAVTVQARDAAEDQLWRAETFVVETPSGRDTVTLNPEALPMRLGSRTVTDRMIVRLGNGRGSDRLAAAGRPVKDGKA